MFKETFNKWLEKDPIAESSVIAYCTIFSLPGLLVIVINVAGYFYDRDTITTQFSTQIDTVLGKGTSKDLNVIIENASQKKKTFISSVLSIATLLIGATGVFNELQKHLNKIWELPVPEKRKIRQLLKDRLFSFGLILVVGFLLLVSLTLSTLLSAFGTWVTNHFSDSLAVLFKLLDVLISFGIITILFAAIYKFLPDTKVRWKDVWPGAWIASTLFILAKYGLAIYFAQSNPESAYGAAGTIVLVMLWVSYSSLILLFGAEFTYVYALKSGRGC